MARSIFIPGAGAEAVVIGYGSLLPESFFPYLFVTTISKFVKLNFPGI